VSIAGLVVKDGENYVAVSEDNAQGNFAVSTLAHSDSFTVADDHVVVSLAPTSTHDAIISDETNSVGYTISVDAGSQASTAGVYADVVVNGEHQYIALNNGNTFSINTSGEQHGQAYSVSIAGLVVKDGENYVAVSEDNAQGNFAVSTLAHSDSFTVADDHINAVIAGNLMYGLPTLSAPGGCEGKHEGDDGVSKDESGLYKVTSGDFSKLFHVSLSGTNPEISVSDVSLKYSLGINSAVPTGLTNGGTEIHLYSVNNTIVGATSLSNASSHPIFTVSVDSNTGVVSFKQYLSVDAVESTAGRAEYNCNTSNHEYSGDHENIGLPTGAILLTATPVIPANKAEDLSGAPDTVSIGSAVKVSFEIHDSYENIKSCSSETLKECTKISFTGSLDDNKVQSISNDANLKDKCDFSEVKDTCCVNADNAKFLHDRGCDSGKLTVTDSVDKIYSHRSDDWINTAQVKVSDSDASRLDHLTVDEALCLKSCNADLGGRSYKIVDTAKNIEAHIDDDAVKHASEARLTDAPETLSLSDRALLSKLSTVTNLDHPSDIGNPVNHDVTQDNSKAQLTATGKLSISDPDGQNTFKAATYSKEGNLGKLTVESNGNYTYSVYNAQVKTMGASATKNETFTIQSTDGTTKDVTFTIHGINDAPTVTANTPETMIMGTSKSIDLLAHASDLDTGTMLQVDASTLSTTVSGLSSGSIPSGLFTLGADGKLTVDTSKLSSLMTGSSKTLTVNYDIIDGDGGRVHQTETITVTGKSLGSVVQGTHTGAGEAESEGHLSLGDHVKINSVSGINSSDLIGKLTFSDDGEYKYCVTDKALQTYLKTHPNFDVHTDNFSVSYTNTETKQTYTQTLSFDIHGTQSSEYQERNAVGGANATKYSGHVEDGYIAGATVFADANNDGILNNGEAFAITDATGGFTLVGGTGNLVMTGGIDITTGLANKITMSAVGGSSVVTPLTTLINNLVANNDLGLTAQDASALLAKQLGLSASIDLSTYDPVTAALTGDANAAKIFAAAVQVENTIVQAAALVGTATGANTADTANALFSSFANALASAPTTGGVSVLSDAATLGTVMTSAASSLTSSASALSTIANAATSVSSLIVSTNNIVSNSIANADPSANIADVLTSVIQVGSAAQGSLANQIASAVASGTSLSTLPSGDALTTLVAAQAATVVTPSHYNAISGDNYINAAEAVAGGVSVAGVAAANSIITLNIGTLTNLPVIADANGSWSYTLSSADISGLGNGTQTVSATATVLNVDGSVAGTANLGTQNFVIDTAAPNAPSITSFVTDSGTINDHLTNDPTPMLQGTGEAGATI
ncbi:VCBS domain-containing protein, partial [Polynucleobacter sp. MWH-UH25E]|uniref:VCBS domain-containing protein n=1 Tax=Polynucleobacter sp. MWH-UH25E TaxID=1855616 RepID=UPI001BFEE42E